VERGSLRLLIDTVADEIVRFRQESEDVTDKSRALIAKAKSEIQAQYDNSEPGPERERLNELMKAIDKRLDELEKEFLKRMSQQQTKVIERSGGIAF
jgi:hypothetical protein